MRRQWPPTPDPLCVGYTHQASLPTHEQAKLCTGKHNTARCLAVFHTPTPVSAVLYSKKLPAFVVVPALNASPSSHPALALPRSADKISAVS